MSYIPQEWRTYASKQMQLNRRSSVDSTAWGLESSLDALLSGSATADTVDRVIANTARRSRYAQSLLAKYIRIDGSFDGLGYLETRSSLTLIGDRLSDVQIELLMRFLSQDRMCGADRTRLSRARAAARDLAV